MMTDSDYISTEQYLAGKLTGDDLTNFQHRLENDAEFAEEVSLMSDILKGMKAAGRKDLKAQLTSLSLGEDSRISKRVPFIRIIGLAASIIITIGAGLWLLRNDIFVHDINPRFFPITTVNIPSEDHFIHNENGAQLKLTSGEIILIPREALVDEQGNLLKEKIKIGCQSFSNPFDQFLAGMPTGFDSANQFKTLKVETMLAISAKSIKEVRFKPSETVQIIVPTKDSIQANQIYKLDTIHKSWQVCGSDMIINLTKEEKTAAPELLIPRLEDQSRPRFKVSSANEKQFPELAAYKNFIFEIAPQEKNYDPSDEKQTWNSFEVKKGKRDEPYLATFKNKTKTVTYQVIPVFSKEYYAQALKTYQEKIEKLESAYQGEDLKKYRLTRYLAQQSSGKNKHAYYRVFSITAPGIYSDSKLISLNDSSTFRVSFTDQLGHPLSVSQLAIADFSRKILRRIKAGKTVKLKIDNITEKALLATTSDNQLAYLTSKEFETAFSQRNPSTIKLNITEINNDNYKKLKAIFTENELTLLLNFIGPK